jgi:hypothetical protein
MTEDFLIQSVDSSTEKQILTGIILSTRYLEEVTNTLRTTRKHPRHTSKIYTTLKDSPLMNPNEP